jgi:hypothetical protein
MSHNPKVGGSNPLPATTEALGQSAGQRVSCLGHRRQASVFAFEATAEDRVYRAFLATYSPSADAASCKGTARTRPSCCDFAIESSDGTWLHVAAPGVP